MHDPPVSADGRRDERRRDHLAVGAAAAPTATAAAPDSTRSSTVVRGTASGSTRGAGNAVAAASLLSTATIGDGGGDDGRHSRSGHCRLDHEQVGPPVTPTPPPPPLHHSASNRGTLPPPTPPAIALQSILKRPAPARLASSAAADSTWSPFVSISPGPSTRPSSTGPGAGLPTLSSRTTTTTTTTLSDAESSPLAAPPPPISPDYLAAAEEDAKPKLPRPGLVTPAVLFSTPGTTSSVFPLSSPSLAESHKFHLGQSDSHDHDHEHGPADPTGTFKSWKSSMMGRRSGMYDRKKLAALGFEEELTRDYDFWASWGIALCNIGGLPGA